MYNVNNLNYMVQHYLGNIPGYIIPDGNNSCFLEFKGDYARFKASLYTNLFFIKYIVIYLVKKILNISLAFQGSFLHDIPIF